MIDLHCHILPGIDDGPSTLAESVALGRALVAAGVDTVAATPHLRDDHPAVEVDELADRCGELAGALDGDGVALKVVPAAEIDLLWALEASTEKLHLASYGQRGSDLLLETPYEPLPSNFEDHLFTLTLAGYRILLAHPERNPTFQDDPKRLARLAERGTLLQITTGSLARPPRRSRSARLAHDLLREGLAHVIASDAHGAGVPGRNPDPAGVEAARRLAGERVNWMVAAVPRAILNGEALPPLPTTPPKRRRWNPLGSQPHQ